MHRKSDLLNMGRVKHNAIVVTSWDKDLIQACADKAGEIGLNVMGPSTRSLNGYRSILACPDGSKLGWPERDEADTQRDVFKIWLRSKRNQDNSSSLEWVEVAYGADVRYASIEDSEWSDKCQ